MAAAGSGNFGIPCQHKQYGSFALTLICPICRQLNENNLDQQKGQPIKSSKKSNKKGKIAERREKKYG